MAVTSSLDVAMVAHIAVTGSLSSAAFQLQLSTSGLSRRLAEVERRLGVTLFCRTTRSLRPTQECERYLAVAQPVLAILDEAEDAARNATDPSAVSGTVRFTAPIVLGRNVIGSMVDTFVESHPNIHVTLLLSDELVDLHGQDVDFAVRYGEMRSASGIAISTLAPNYRVICGAPAYLDRVGRPTLAIDLVRHNCLTLRTPTSDLRVWPVGHSRIEVVGDRSTSDSELLRSWAIDGRGLVLKSWWDVRDDLAAGRLEALFPDQPRAWHPLRLARPAGAGAPLRVRRLTDHLKSAFRLLGMPIGGNWPLQR